jgi:aspartate-semialdehyde dehydrogenase
VIVVSGRERIPVAVLGATGMVGERLVALLEGHAWFRLTEVAASDRSAGDRLGDRLSSKVLTRPDGSTIGFETADLELRSLDGPFTAPLVLSALPAEAAREVEPRLAAAGHLVVSNASAFRTDPGVPLLVPEVNPDHLALLDTQSTRWPGAGGLITNPNCSVAGLVVALKPLHDAFGVRALHVTTLQAISGAGRPGPGAWELVDNVLPFIAGEEQKLASEPRKILGSLGAEAIDEAGFEISATCTRVPVLYGHLAAVSALLEGDPAVDDVRAALESFRSPLGDLRLPSAPERTLEVLAAPDRPQPRPDRDRGRGMTVTVGRVRPCPLQTVRFVVLSHNLVRGAAGAALLNAELAAARGHVPGHEQVPVRAAPA